MSQLPIANWHDAIGEFAKAHGSEEQNDPGFKEKTADIALDDYPVKADVIEFDVVWELLKKCIIHGILLIWYVPKVYRDAAGRVNLIKEGEDLGIKRIYMAYYWFYAQ